MASNNRRRNPAGAIVALLILVMIIIALVVVLRQGGGDVQESPGPDAQESAAPSASPQEEPETEATPTPAPTPTPTPTPEPTETPQPSEPAQEAVGDAEGALRSDTGTGLEIRADWSLSAAEGGAARLTVRLYAESYSLQTREIWHGAVLSVGGQSYEFDTQEVDYAGPVLGENELGELSVELEGLSLPAEASVTWRFQGSYGGEELEEITASGVIG